MSKKPPWRVQAGGNRYIFTSREKAYLRVRELQDEGLQVSVYHWERNDWILYERLRKRETR